MQARSGRTHYRSGKAISQLNTNVIIIEVCSTNFLNFCGNVIGGRKINQAKGKNALDPVLQE
jgi:hypothetical protein